MAAAGSTDPDAMLPEYDFSDAERGRYAGRFHLDPETPEGSTVVLRRGLPEHGLHDGDVGTVVRTHRDDAVFEVEFMLGSGDAVAVLRLAASDLRALDESEILHARRITQARS